MVKHPFRKTLSLILVVSLICSFLSIPAAFAAVAEIAAIDDHTPPVIDGIFMNAPGATVHAGDTLNFSVYAEDNSSISRGSLTFHMECDHGIIHSISAYLDHYDETTHLANFVLYIDESVLNGVWNLYSIDLSDPSWNSTSLYPDAPGNADFSSIQFTVDGNTKYDDHIGPSIGQVYMENPNAIVKSGDTLHFTVNVEDDSCVSRGSLTFQMECNYGEVHKIYANLEYYDETAKLAHFNLFIDESTLNGVWNLYCIDLSDPSWNSTSVYSENPGDIDFSLIQFTVDGNSSEYNDQIGPSISQVSMDTPNAVVESGDTLVFTVYAKDDSSISRGSLTFQMKCDYGEVHKIYAYLDRYDETTNLAYFKLYIDDSILNGAWSLYCIDLSDPYWNDSTIYSEDPGEIDFSSITFTVFNPSQGPQTLSIPESITLPVRKAQTIQPTVTPPDAHAIFTWSSSDTSIATAYSDAKGAGIITRISPGTATITCTTDNGLEATCEVTVTEASTPTDAAIEANYQIGVSGWKDIYPKLTPPDATALFEASSDNPHVASVELLQGGMGIRIRGNNAGHATVTIRSADGLKMETQVQVGKDSDRQHEKIKVEGREPTCWYEGYTEETRCSECGYVFSQAGKIL